MIVNCLQSRGRHLGCLIKKKRAVRQTWKKMVVPISREKKKARESGWFFAIEGEN